MYTCIVCDKEVKDGEEFEWHGYDGEKIHKQCKPKLQQKYDYINSMSDEEFKNYIRGE